MICADDALAVQKDFVATDFVRPLPITVGDDQTQQPVGTWSRNLSVWAHGESEKQD